MRGGVGLLTRNIRFISDNSSFGGAFITYYKKLIDSKNQEASLLNKGLTKLIGVEFYKMA